MYSSFLSTHSVDSVTSTVPAQELISSYQARLTPGMTNLWQEVGFCSFDDGLFRLVNPQEWTSTLEEFGIDGTSIVFIVSSFGILIYQDEEGKIHQFTPILNHRKQVSRKLDYYMEGNLSDPSYYKDTFLHGLHKKALKRLGPLSKDEIYGFQPLLSMGGTEDIDHVIKAKAREHLSLIAQSI